MFFFKESYDERGRFRFEKFTKQCRFKGDTTSTTTYTPSAEESRLMGIEADIAEAMTPNVYRLNNTATDILWDSIGSNQVDFNTMNNRAQNQIYNATNGLSGLIGSNNAAAQAANNVMSSISPQYSELATAGNNALGGYQRSNTSAVNNANALLGSVAPQYTEAANATNNALSGYQSGNTTATNSTNSLLGSVAPQYSELAGNTNAQLASLANGVLPTAYQENMQNAISSSLQNTMGKALNNLGQRGVLNSSVTNSTMNDISRNAADAVAQQYQNNINTVAGLTGQQLSNANNALGQQSDIYSQQLANSMNLNNANAGLASEQLANTNAALGQQTDLYSQQLGNTMNLNNTNAGLSNQQLTNALGALDNIGNVGQTQYQNLLNANATNAGLYGNLIDSSTAGISAGAAAQEAAQQPALNLWQASVGLSPSGNGALSAVAGKGTTTTTQSTSGGSGWLGGVAGLLGAGIQAWCFASDTVIKMANGSAKLIQDIKAGDKVVCPHADGSESVEMVTEVMEPHFADVYAVTVKYDGDKYHTVLTTSTQPLLCADGTFITVGNMKLNKELYGGYVIQSIEYDEFCEVYDLKVTGENNYYADGLVAKGGTIEW